MTKNVLDNKIMTNEIKRIKRLDYEIIKFIKKIRRVFPSRIVKRGKNGSTTYALVPLKFRKQVKPCTCLCKFIKTKKRKYLIFELK